VRGRLPGRLTTANRAGAGTIRPPGRLLPRAPSSTPRCSEHFSLPLTTHPCPKPLPSLLTSFSNNASRSPAHTRSEPTCCLLRAQSPPPPLRRRLTLCLLDRFARSCQVYAPLITPFKSNGDVDFEAVKAQVVRVAKAGMGLVRTTAVVHLLSTDRAQELTFIARLPSTNQVIHGTNAEACHLSHEERSLVVKEARKALDGANLKDVPLLVGTGGQSARESIQLAKEAKEAGADFS